MQVIVMYGGAQTFLPYHLLEFGRGVFTAANAEMPST